MLKIKSVRSKILFGFLVVVLIPFFAMGFIFFDSFYSEISREMKNKLLLFAEIKERQITSHLDMLEARTLEFASDVFIRDNISLTNATTSNISSFKLNQYLLNNKQTLDDSIIEIALIDNNGLIVAGTNKNELGKDESREKYFTSSQKGIFTKSISNYERFGVNNVFAVSAPLHDKLTGRLIGVIVIYYSTDDLNNNLLDLSQSERGIALYNKGYSDAFKTYLVHSENEMFIYQGNNFSTEKSLTAKKVLFDTLPIKKCLLYEEEIIDKYVNYEGKKVLGASMCFPNQGWILVSEIEEKDMLISISSIIKRLFIVFISILLLIILVSLYVSIIITRPINHLKESAKEILNGNLKSRAKVDGSDEIGELAMYYNIMTKKLEKSMENIEKKVEDRTSHLYKLNRAMVGRELKMIELKKKNQDLKKAINKLKKKYEN